MTLHRAERLEDPGARLLDQAASLWARRGRFVVIALGSLVVAGGLVFFGLRARARAEDQAANRLADAGPLFWQGEYKRSSDVAKLVAEQWPSTPSGIDAHRLAGDNAYWSGDFKTAAKEYRAYLERQKKGVLADAVRRSLAASLESDRQYAEAASIYVGLVGVFDRVTSAEFLNSAARCQRQADNKAEAIKLLQRVVDEYGETSFATGARVDLAELKAAQG